MTENVESYIKKQPSPQREICERLREIILRALPHVREEMKWGVPTYDGGAYYIVALKDHVNLGFSMVGLSGDEVSQFVGSGTMKHVEIRTVGEIDEAHITRLLQLVWNASR
ncbi:MAG: DUF1801 domain-containing protein [Euryarchaeota archaeon]|jgi:hypothetical protein|nr:DUF1801 domain-containing protein [Euryarchaeota archaeon]